ncbi:MAG: carboxypeptidase-like regulatory domain-containing protein [Bacteroidetes bacterium]|nr:carboxypeptidase-like regulatory domain-containing protein [Bacteroidota bacterium]MBS1591394.1 carboxypeptidase-like regulatory domain-containing protein [Bacteroidota bacterium]
MKIFAFLTLLFCCFCSSAQNIIVHGTVVDAATSAPVSNAMVFINQSTHGQITDSLGSFSITDVNETQFEIIVYAKQYEPIIYRFTKNQINKRIKFALFKKQTAKQPKTDSFLANNILKWQQLFLQEFLGVSTNAEDCYVANLSSLIFTVDTATRFINVTATEPLQVFNESLGYYITCYLHECTLTEKQELNSIEYYTWYKPSTTKREEMITKWKTRRHDAYDASIMQFMRAFYKGSINNTVYSIKKIIRYYEDESPSLFNNAKKNNGASAVQTEAVATSNNEYRYRKFIEVVDKEELPIAKIRLTDTLNNAMVFVGKNKYQILYRSKIARLFYYNNGANETLSQTVTSSLNLTDNLLIFSSGRFFDDTQLNIQGYWHLLRLADILPFDYVEEK